MLDKLGSVIAKFLGEDLDTDFVSHKTKVIDEIMRVNSIEEILPYYSYDEKSKIFINKRSYGFILELSPLLGSNKNIEREISGLFKSTMPPGANLQFLMIASPKIGARLDNWQREREGRDDIIKELAERRAEYFKSFAYSPSKMKEYRLFLSYSTSLNGSITEYNKKITRDLRETVRALFQSVGLASVVLDASSLLPLIASIVAPKKTLYHANKVWNKVASISSQISNADTSLQVKPGGLVIDEGEFLIRNYNVVNYPSKWYLGAMDLLIGDNYRDLLQLECPFMVSYNIHFCDDKSLQTKMLAKGTRVEAQSNSPLSRIVKSLSKQANEWQFVREQLEVGERLVRTSYLVSLYSDADNISKDEQRLLSLYRSNEWDLSPTKYIHLPALISMLPMSWGDGMARDSIAYKLSRITLSHEPTNTLPIQGEWKGTNTPGMLLTSRKGQIFYWSPIAADKDGNYNVSVVGRSGSGKSVFMQDLMTSFLGLGGKVFVLDVGRSFEKTAKLMGGNFIEFSAQSKICINPFTYITTNDPKEALESLSMLKSIIALMAAPNDGVSDLEYSFIEKALIKTWKEKQVKSTITDVVKALESFDDKRAHDLSIMLGPYTKDGTYGSFFEGDANINFDNILNVIEMEELKSKKDLQSVIVQIFIMQVTDRMFLGDRTCKYAIVFDEAWDMLRGKQSGDFIETLARRLRKYKSSLIVGTQGIDDFYRTEGARAAFDNSDWVCMLSQKQESIDQLKKSGRFKVTEAIEEMLTSIHTKPGEYAEVMIRGSKGLFLGRLILDPFSKILYSTKAEEYSRVQELQKQGYSLTESVSKTADEAYGYGNN